MTPILCIETSTKVCSVCISDGHTILAIAEDDEEEYTHAERLNVLIAEVIKLTGLEFLDLRAIAISEGPGSYTGLRIGVSTAKGIAMACNIPIIAINTLKAMTYSVADQNPENLFIPMIDARRMEVFCSGFSGDLNPVFETRAQVIDPGAFPEGGDYSNVYFFGNGAEKTREMLEPLGFEYISGISASSAGMASLAYEKFRNADFVDTAYFEPFYLKDFVAGKPKKSF